MHRLRWLLSPVVATALFVGALSTPATAESPFAGGNLPDVPDFGDSAAAALTPAQERRLGQAFMRNVRSSEKVVDDPLLTGYLQSLGRRLAAGNAGGSFTFVLIDDPAINAFAGPAGHIGVNTGLILTTEAESELAAVLNRERTVAAQVAAAADARPRRDLARVANDAAEYASVRVRRQHAT